MSTLAVLTAVAEAHADGQDLEGLLNESVVTAASDTTETGRDAPATSTVITGEGLRKYGIRTLAEALNFLALGTATGQTTGDSTELGARGVNIVGSNWEHFLLLIDGARANGVVFGEAEFGIAAVPLEIVDRIEVILGPGSVLYGSNAMLGVINVVTKRAKDFAGVRVGLEASSFAAFRPYAGYGATFEVAGVPGEVTAEFEYYGQRGPSLYYAPVNGGIDPATKAPFRYTTATVGTGVWGGGSSTALTTIESTSLIGRVRLGKFALTFDGQMGNSPVRVSVYDFDTRASDVTRRLLVNLAYDAQLTRVLALNAHAYVGASDGATTIVTSWAPTCVNVTINCRNDLRAEGIATGVEATPSFDWLGNGAFVTRVGVDAVARSARSIFARSNAATGLPVATSTGLINHKDGALGAYAQQTWQPAPWFGVNAGGRLDYDPRFDAPVLSPRLALRADVWQGGTAKFIYSEAFRAPSFFESYFSHPVNPLPENLQPERVRSVEGSIEQRFGAQRVLFGTFATRWTNLIAYYNFSAAGSAQYVAEGKALLPPLYQYRNLSSVANWGYNAAFEGSLVSDTLQYGVNVTGAVTHVESSNTPSTPMTASPHLSGNAHVSYRLPGALPTLALVTAAQSPRPVENAFTSGFAQTPYVPTQIVLQATISGDVLPIAGLSYRITGFYSTLDRQPYLVGPNVASSATYSSPSLVPIERARAMVGLEYRFAQ